MDAIDYAALLKPEKLVFIKPVKGKTRFSEEYIDGKLHYAHITDLVRYKNFPPETLESVHYAEDGTAERLERTKAEKSVEPTLYRYYTVPNVNDKTGIFSFSVNDTNFVMEDTVDLKINRLLQRRYLYNGCVCSYKGLPATSSYDKRTGELIEETWAIQKKARNRWYGTSTTHRPVAEGPAVIQYKDGKIIKQIFMENGKVRKDPAEVKAATRKKRAITAGQVAEWISSQPENISKLNEVLDVALQVSVGEKR